MSDARVQQYVTALLAVIITLTVCAMWVLQIEVPELAKGTLTLIVGYFIGNVRTNGFGGMKNRPTDRSEP